MAGLSVASVSRVLNRHDNVHPDTRERVLAAVRALGYVPNAAARSLSTARTQAIGVVLPDLHGEFFSELVRGMDKAASERGYMLLLSNMHADSQLAGQAMGAMLGRVDGMVVMAPQISAGELKTVLPRGVPAVLVNCPAEQGFQAIKIDNRAGVRLMVRHMLDSGRKQIVHLSGPLGNIDGAERRAAFVEAMADFAPKLPARVAEGDFTEASGASLVADLLAKHAEFDAIFAANDMMAMGVLMALREAEIAVPGQVSVAGYDDIPLARYLGLSTVRCDMVGMGALAIERLLDQIDEKSQGELFEQVEPELVVRQTTGRS
jgi:LacI family transcriptional regulator